MNGREITVGQSHFTRLLMWMALAFLVGTYICQPVADPDLWWHITIGKWILAHREVPHVDYWNMFSTDRIWRAYSWSNEVVLALVDTRFGERGLAVLQILLGVGLVASLQYFCGRLARDRFIGALFGTYAAASCFNNFTLRPQVLVWILFAAAIVLCDEIVEKGCSRLRLLLLALVGSLWANTHLTAILGLGAIFLWTIQGPRRAEGDSSQGASPIADLCLKRCISACSAFLFGTFVTPYLGGEWLTFFVKGGHPLKYQAIAEFQPATILQFSSVFVLLMVFLLLVVSYTTRSLPTLSRGILASVMLLAGLTAVKFLPFAAITWVSLFAVWWRESGAQHRNLIHDNFADGLLLARDGLWGLSSKTGSSLVFLAFAIASVKISDLLQVPVNRSLIPAAAVDFIDKNQLPHPVLNEFSTGGYLMYRWSDAQGTPIFKVSIDGRTNVNPDAVWEMYRASFSGKESWHQFIDKVNAQTVVWRNGSPMVTILLESSQWCRVFKSGKGDEDHSVFIRSDLYYQRFSMLASTDCPPQS